MSLHFPLYINEKAIGYFTARRIKGDMEPDSVNLYEVKIWTTYPGEGDQPNHSFQIHHRYGDGAWKLIFRALELVEKDLQKERQWNPKGLTRGDFLSTALIREAIASTNLDGETHPV